MKTLLFLLIPTLIFSQSKDFKKETLFNRVKNSYENTDLKYDDSTIKLVIKTYVCLNKNYNFKFKDQPIFLTKKEYFKKFGKGNVYSTHENDFLQQIFLRNYQQRIEMQKGVSKCISKKEVDF